jgi:hypothetical protein
VHRLLSHVMATVVTSKAPPVQEKLSLAILNLVVAAERGRLNRSNGKVRNFMVVAFLRTLIWIVDDSAGAIEMQLSLKTSCKRKMMSVVFISKD